MDNETQDNGMLGKARSTIESVAEYAKVAAECLERLSETKDLTTRTCLVLCGALAFSLRCYCTEGRIAPDEVRHLLRRIAGVRFESDAE